MDERLNFLSKISRPIFTYAQTYFCLFIGYTSIRKKGEWLNVLNGVVIIFGIVGLYGIITSVLNNNPYYDLIWASFSEASDKGMWSEIQTRGYRVFSTLNNPIPYGFIMGATATVLVTQTRKQTFTSITLFAIIILNLFLSNSRTSLLATIILLSVYGTLLLRYNSKIKYLRSLLILSLLLLGAYYTIPAVSASVDSVIDIFVTGGSATQGTTTDLKQRQWIATLYYFQKSPIWGNGFSFFLEDILINDLNEDLYGLEGYIFKLLVEEGIVQLILVTIFFSLLIRYFLSYWDKTSDKLVIYCVSLIAAFLFFIIGTGTYGNIFVFIFCLIGAFLRKIELTRKKL